MFKRRNRPTEADRSFVVPESVITAGHEAATPDNHTGFRPEVIYDGGANDYSVAVGPIEKGRRACAIRWNGDDGMSRTGTLPVTGTPMQGGAAQWFVLPEFLWVPTIDACKSMTSVGIGTPRKAST